MMTVAKPQTIPDLVDAGYSKNTVGLVCATKRGGTWIEKSIEEFRSKVRQFALGLHEIGVRRGDRVALHSENCSEWLVVDQAVLRLGAVTVPIYTTQPPDQVRYILEHSEARVYVVSTEALFASVRSHLSGIETLQDTVGILGSYRSGMLTFDELIDKGRGRLAESSGLVDQSMAALVPDDLATIVYTSGTTGSPKGVMLTHGNLVFDTLASLHALPIDVERERGGIVLSYLPLSHAFERTVALICLHIGFPVYFVENVEEIAEDLASVRPVFFSTVPRLLEKIHAGIKTKARAQSGAEGRVMRWAIGLAESYDLDRVMGVGQRLRYALADRLVFSKIRARFGGNLVSILSGGAALSPATMSFFNALGVFCGQGYGMTETSPIIATSTPKALRSGSVGKPLQGVEIAIADDGEILTRGPHVMKGYYKQPEETAAVKTEDGWLHTGDIGRLDEDGFLYLTDRKKELFKLSTGKYIAPLPIELTLGGSSLIEHVVVVGNERKFCAALLVPDIQAVRGRIDDNAVSLSDAELLAQDVVTALIQQEIDASNAALAHWEQIKRFRLLATSFSIEGGELTPTLKIKRRVVHQKYGGEIEALYR